jgi:hypothetical protein
MTTATSLAFLEGFNSQLDELCKDETEQKFSGRGIVISAGGVSMFTNAYVLIHVLRKHLSCMLPIEVWHFGGTELSPRMRSLLRELDVTTVDAAGLAKAKAAPIRDGWQLKSFAVLWSRFAEVLLLDADQIPAVDPAVAFNWPEYQKSGAVFWPDVVELREDNPIWDLVGLPKAQLRSFESGQVLVDKRRHWKALCATYLLNAAAETVYQLIYGDKDTFLIGWQIAQSQFSLVPHLPFVDEYCLSQRDFSGELFLQHRTNGKWSYAGEQFRPQRVLHEEASLAALAELRRKWNGRIFLPPDRSLAAREMESKLVAIGTFHFEIEGEAPTTLEFLADGEFGMGRNHDAQNWAVVDDVSAPMQLKLVIMHSSLNTFFLVVDARGHWSGQRTRKPTIPVTAIPAREMQEINIESTGETLVDEFLNAANFFNLAAEADNDLAAAFKLLAQFEPNVEKRLRLLSQQQRTDDDHKLRLEALADLVKASEIGGLRPVEKDLNLLDRGYIR